MRLLFNIVWWVLFGWLVALVFYALGVVLTLLVVTAPIGLGLMQYGKFLLAPFSMEMISEAKFQLDADKNSAWKAYSGVVMIVYVLCAGIWLALGVALFRVCSGYHGSGSTKRLRASQVSWHGI